MDKIFEILCDILKIASLVALFYVVPYIVRLGWSHAENRTKKVCDLCFRDIKRFNSLYSKVDPSTKE